jgi:hypothetical protein
MKYLFSWIVDLFKSTPDLSKYYNGTPEYKWTSTVEYLPFQPIKEVEGAEILRRHTRPDND